MQKYKEYSEYYDYIYGDKDYLSEVEFVDGTIKKFAKDAKSILSLGCGTCNHDILFVKKGYILTSVDQSKQMLTIAQNKISSEGVGKNIKLVNADICKMKNVGKHDIALAMFNVFGYFVKNQDVDKVLKNISQGLRKGGLLMFDCWYLPAVIKNGPTDKVKEIKSSDKRIVRLTSSKLNTLEDSIDITFRVLDIKDKELVAEVCETHTVRFWSLPELEYILATNGFKLIKASVFMDLDLPVTADNWNIFIIAEKVV